MSGVLKSIGKVFRKVVKTVKKVLPAALAIGAVVFTAGSAMGMLPTWGSAVGGLVSNLGMSSTLSNVLTGAITQAGYGAALGAATSAVTGGDVGKGAGIGAVTGAVTGGLTGGLGGEVDPIGKAITGQPTMPGEITPAPGAAPVEAQPLAGNGMDPRAVSNLNAEAAQMGLPNTAAPAPVAAAPTGMGGPTVAPGAVAAPAAASSGNGLLGPGGWIERNQTLVGNAASGLGKGLMAMAAADDKSDYADYARIKADIARENYSHAGPGLLRAQDMAYINAQPPRPTPEQRFDPRTYNGRWVFDPTQGKITWVPNQQQA